jgi:hypothetical protein
VAGVAFDYLTAATLAGALDNAPPAEPAVPPPGGAGLSPEEN